jgi:hypothetical protein
LNPNQKLSNARCIAEYRQAAAAFAEGLAIGDFEMRTPDEYREFAAECYRWAAEAKTEAYQKMIEEMARAWSEVAEELETRIAQQKWGAKDCS